MVPVGAPLDYLGPRELRVDITAADRRAIYTAKAELDAGARCFVEEGCGGGPD